MAEQRKAVIKNADMSEAMQQDAVDVASVALSKYNIEKVCKVDSRAFLCVSLQLLTLDVSFLRMLPLTSRKNLTRNTTQHGKDQKCHLSGETTQLIIIHHCVVQACYCWKKLWKLCNTRDKTFHLLLPWASCSVTVQKWLKFFPNQTKWDNLYRFVVCRH